MLALESVEFVTPVCNLVIGDVDCLIFERWPRVAGLVGSTLMEVAPRTSLLVETVLDCIYIVAGGKFASHAAGGIGVLEYVDRTCHNPFL